MTYIEGLRLSIRPTGQISANRKTIGDITELSIQAFDQREECQSKIQALQVSPFLTCSLSMSKYNQLTPTLNPDLVGKSEK